LIYEDKIEMESNKYCLEQPQEKKEFEQIDQTWI
jgi:hypothetical protein